MKPLILIPLLLLALQAAASPVIASKAGDMQTALDDLSLALANHGYQLVKVQPLGLLMLQLRVLGGEVFSACS